MNIRVLDRKVASTPLEKSNTALPDLPVVTTKLSSIVLPIEDPSKESSRSSSSERAFTSPSTEVKIILEETLASKDKKENAERKQAVAKRTPCEIRKCLMNRGTGSSLGKKDFKMLEKDETNKARK